MQNIKSLKIIKIFILLIGILFIKNIDAAELPTFEVGNSLVKTGEEIEVPIAIKNNVGFSIIGMKIDFDENSLTYIDGEMLGFENFSMKDLAINDSNIISFYAISFNEVYTNNQNLLLLKFKVNDNALDSDINLDVTDYATSDLETLEYQVINGRITITNPKEVQNDNSENNSKTNKEDNSKTVTDKKIEKVKVGNKINYNLENNHKLESSNNDIAVINEDNTITFNKPGKVEIVETNEYGEIVNTKQYNVVKKRPIIIYIIIVLILLIFILIMKNIKDKKSKKSKNLH